MGRTVVEGPWLFLLSEDAVRKLGGLDAVRDSHAFETVEMARRAAAVLQPLDR
jgi:hypothetical protein